MMRPIPLALSLALALVLAACGSTGQGYERKSRNHITAEELGSREFGSAADAIRYLRPAWFRVLHRHGAERTLYPAGGLQVYIDGNYLGKVEILETLRVHHIQSLRFLSPGEAMTRYGQGHQDGAIVVTTTTGSR
jgi:hypothetical protein